jgi:hypothetical protein
MLRSAALVGTVLAIALALTLILSQCGHDATSQRLSPVLTNAELLGKDCVTSFGTLSIEVEHAMEDPETMHVQLGNILDQREQLCDRAASAFQEARSEHAWNDDDLIKASQRLEELRTWITTIRVAFAHYEEAPSASTLQYLRSLM